jgi:hypothetical protein
MSSRKQINLWHLAFAVVLLALALGGSNPAHSQEATSPGASATVNSVPQIIQFSGTLSGAPSGTVSITFTLYENEQGGTALWSETQNVAVNAQGQYTVLLGSASPDGLPLNLFTTAQAHWLAVQPLLQGLAEPARVLLVSAPYALKAGDAETIGGLPPSAFVRADGFSAASGATSATTTPSTGTTDAATIPSSGIVAGPLAEGKKHTPTTPVNYNVTVGYQINGDYVVQTPGSLTTGINTALGVFALSNNTTGTANSASGYAALFNNTIGIDNTASGWGAMNDNTSGNENTATGFKALYSNTTASYNAANGFGALYANTTGADNTASGFEALLNNTTASGNTATGYSALATNTTGANNTASGTDALFDNTTGANNTAAGAFALEHSTTASDNLAAGYGALYTNTTGADNAASGYSALYSNTTGGDNTASGADALEKNTTGSRNTSSGTLALSTNTTGSNNIAIGYEAALDVAAGNSNDIEIGSEGASIDSAAIRIGTVGTQTSSYIAGIYGVTLPTAGQPLVCVDSAGQLGTLNCATSGAPSAEQEAINRKQQEQIQALQKQNEDLQQRLSRLEALIAKN